MRPLKKYKTGFRVRIEDFFGNNSHQAKRSQIRLSERKRVPNLQCSEMQNCSASGGLLSNENLVL